MALLSRIPILYLSDRLDAKSLGSQWRRRISDIWGWTGKYLLVASIPHFGPQSIPRPLSGQLVGTAASSTTPDSKPDVQRAPVYPLLFHRHLWFTSGTLVRYKELGLAPNCLPSGGTSSLSKLMSGWITETAGTRDLCTRALHAAQLLPSRKMTGLHDPKKTQRIKDRGTRDPAQR